MLKRNRTKAGILRFAQNDTKKEHRFAEIPSQGSGQSFYSLWNDTGSRNHRKIPRDARVKRPTTEAGMDHWVQGSPLPVRAPLGNAPAGFGSDLGARDMFPLFGTPSLMTRCAD